MSAPQWTPGPWQWVGYDEIEQVEHPFTSVADLVRIYGDNEHTQRNANARLIAAAPKMYAALEQVTRIVLEQRCERGTPWDLACTTIAEKLREHISPVLADARGETL